MCSLLRAGLFLALAQRHLDLGLRIGSHSVAVGSCWGLVNIGPGDSNAEEFLGVLVLEAL